MQVCLEGCDGPWVSVVSQGRVSVNVRRVRVDDRGRLHHTMCCGHFVVQVCHKNVQLRGFAVGMQVFRGGIQQRCAVDV